MNTNKANLSMLSTKIHVIQVLTTNQRLTLPNLKKKTILINHNR